VKHLFIPIILSLAIHAFILSLDTSLFKTSPPTTPLKNRVTVSLVTLPPRSDQQADTPTNKPQAIAKKDKLPSKPTAKPKPKISEPQKHAARSEPQLQSRKPEPRNPAPQPEPPKLTPKSESQKLKTKVEPQKPAPKPEPRKLTPKTQPQKPATKPKPRKPTSIPEPQKLTPKPQPQKLATKPKPRKPIPKPEPRKLTPKTQPQKPATKPTPRVPAPQTEPRKLTPKPVKRPAETLSPREITKKKAVVATNEFTKWERPKRSLKKLTKKPQKVTLTQKVAPIKSPKLIEPAPKARPADDKSFVLHQKNPLRDSAARPEPINTPNSPEVTAATESFNPNITIDTASKEKPSAGAGWILAKPLYRKNPPPNYPRQARRKRYEGVVILEVLVDDNGEVEDLKVFKSSGFKVLDKSARSAVRKWFFEPGTKNGKATAMWVKVPIRFRLEQ